MLKKRVAVLVSGGGTNLQALIDAERDGRMPHAEIALVISNRKDAYALERAANAGIEGMRIGKKDFDARLIEALASRRIDVVVLAGFLAILGSDVISRYEGRILNVHPSLIPSFCGMGYYGLRVHEAALARGVKVTGATVHIVSEIPDGGPILAQKAVEIVEGDTPETLQRRVMEQAEWVLLPRETELICEKLIEAEA